MYTKHDNESPKKMFFIAVNEKTAGLSDKTGKFLFCLAENFSLSHKCPATRRKSQIW